MRTSVNRTVLDVTNNQVIAMSVHLGFTETLAVLGIVKPAIVTQKLELVTIVRKVTVVCFVARNIAVCVKKIPGFVNSVKMDFLEGTVMLVQHNAVTMYVIRLMEIAPMNAQKAFSDLGAILVAQTVVKTGGATSKLENVRRVVRMENMVKSAKTVVLIIVTDGYVTNPMEIAFLAKMEDMGLIATSSVRTRVKTLYATKLTAIVQMDVIKMKHTDQIVTHNVQKRVEIGNVLIQECVFRVPMASVG